MLSCDMSSAQDPSLPVVPPSTFLRRVQLIDFLGQVACFFTSIHFSDLGYNPSRNGLANLFSGAFGILFRLGTWQFVSALLYLLVWRYLPGRKRLRRLHLWIAGGLVSLWIISFPGAESGLSIGVLLVGFGALYFSPVLACLYFYITALDLWELPAPAPEVPIKDPINLTLVPPTLLLLFALASCVIRGFSLDFNFLLSLGTNVGSTSVALIGLAGWLLASYLNALRRRQASILETVCAVWTLVLFCWAILRFTLPAPALMYSFWAALLRSPMAALSGWFAAVLWRGPVREAVPLEEMPAGKEENPL